MKNAVFTLLLGLIVFIGKGQPPTTKIYFVKNGAQTFGPLEIYTTLNPNQPITIKNNGYALVETDADSLGFTNGPSYTYSGSEDYHYSYPHTKPNPTFIQFERGKTYFFKLGPVVYSSHMDVEEMSERAFWLYVGLNNLGSNQKRYFLSNTNGLVKGQL